MTRALLALLCLAGLVAPAPVVAQMDWLTPHLESQRAKRLQDHQRRLREKSQAQERTAEPVSLAERQAVWSRNKPEYRRRLLRDGQASADRWLDELARAQR